MIQEIAADSIIKIKNLMHLILCLFFSLQMNNDYLSLFLRSHINGTLVALKLFTARIDYKMSLYNFSIRKRLNRIHRPLACLLINCNDVSKFNSTPY